mmetsp:Transcript_43212/g.124913  ORF Transcript_43212/g.124913 Transcript_43212/m.124913 type:complete len:245 (+) Transcript_43212:1083-1817(+)
MISFQASPVAALNKVMNAVQKFLKLPCWFNVSSSWDDMAKRLTPRMLNKIRNKHATTPTFASFTKETANEVKSLFIGRRGLNFNNRKRRAMRKILITEANEDILMPLLLYCKMMPSKVAATHPKSNRFQVSRQYELRKATNFSNASTVNTKAKNILMASLQSRHNCLSGVSSSGYTSMAISNVLSTMHEIIDRSKTRCVTSLNSLRRNGGSWCKFVRVKTCPPLAKCTKALLHRIHCCWAGVSK